VSVSRGDIRQVVETTGRVESNLDVEIKCKASGEVTALPYDISDSVQKGGLLVELDPVDEKRSVKQAEVQLSASKARLDQAGQNLRIAEEQLKTEKKRVEATLKAAKARDGDTKAKSERLKTLLSKKLTSQENYDSAMAAAIQSEADLEKARISLEELAIEEMALELKRRDVDLASSQVQLNEISLEQAQQRLDDTKVVSPIDGVVVQRAVQIGQIISSGISNVGGGTTVMTLSDLSRLYVVAFVDESDIGRIKTGQKALITVDAFPDKRFRGEIVRVAMKGVTVSNVVTFEVKIEVQGKNKSLLKPEMTANCEIVIAEEIDTLVIPAEAVNRRRKERFVTIQKSDGTKEERSVTAGSSDGVNTQIIEGLQEGEQIILRKGEEESRWRQGGRGRGMRNMFVRRSGR
jgi:HlyD family secretion protein